MSPPAAEPDAVRWVVLDIEGTLMATAQVHVGLYEYARPRLGPWIEAHGDEPAVAAAVAATERDGGLPAGSPVPDVVAVLHGWMDEDRKAGPLKALQGEIWQHGYAAGELVTELFPDVAPTLRGWHARGLGLAIFSSGAVAGQVAAFSRTTDGDLTGLFAHHFDTANAGPKREAASYEAMTAALGAEPEQVLLLSDVPAELDAAAEAGWGTVGLARPGEPYADADFGDHPVVDTLAAIDP
jgi:enolase-phosphatase E1